MACFPNSVPCSIDSQRERSNSAQSALALLLFRVGLKIGVGEPVSPVLENTRTGEQHEKESVRQNEVYL